MGLDALGFGGQALLGDDVMADLALEGVHGVELDSLTGGAHAGDGLVHDLAIALLECPPKAGVGTAPEPDQLLDRHVADVALFGQDDADDGGQLSVIIRGERAVEQVDRAAERGLEGREGAQQGGFAHAIGAEEARQFAAVDRGVEVFGHALRVVLVGVADAEVAEADSRFFHSFTSFLRLLKST